MSKYSAIRYRSQLLCPLPVDAINKALGTELEPGCAWLSVKAHEHIARDHPLDYPVCFPLLNRAIATPTFAGQAPSHSRNFELVTRFPTASAIVLTAIRLTPNDQGNYHVTSAYLIEQKDVEARRRSGRLRPIIRLDTS